MMTREQSISNICQREFATCKAVLVQGAIADIVADRVSICVASFRLSFVEMRKLLASRGLKALAATTATAGSVLCMNQQSRVPTKKGCAKISGDGCTNEINVSKRHRPFSFMNIFVYADDDEGSIITTRAKASGDTSSSSESKPSGSNEPSVQEEGSDDDDDAWEEQKKKCGFCRHFLESPCKQQFKVWSKCVDGAKDANEDFVVKCSECTQHLITCTADYPDYFLAAMEAAGEDQGEGVEEEQQEQEVESDAKGEAVGGWVGGERGGNL